MKQYFLLSIPLVLLSFISGQIKQHFKLSNPKIVNTGTTIRIGSTKFSFTADNQLDFLFMDCLNFKGEPNGLNTLKDSVEYSPYQSKLYSFSLNTNEYVILWVTEYEYYPSIMAYYLQKGNIYKIGNLEIADTDSLGESFEYPIECIEVDKLDDIIEFSFSKDVNFKTNDNKWKLYKAGAITYSYSIARKKFEVIQ